MFMKHAPPLFRYALAMLLLFAALGLGVSEVAHADPVTNPCADAAFAADPNNAAQCHEAGSEIVAAIPLVLKLIEALQAKSYVLATGMALTIFVILGRKFAPTYIPKEYMATALLGFSAIGGFAAGLMSGMPPLDAALTFLLTGSVAIALWEGVFRHLKKLWAGGSPAA